MDNKQARLWINNTWIYFNVKFKLYNNIIIFLDENKLSFVKYNYINFNKIPKQLHGYGKSTNLIEYLTNNNHNNKIIISFLNFFIQSLKFSYRDGSKMKISLTNNNDWRTSQIKVSYQDIKILTVDITSLRVDMTSIKADNTIYIM